MSPAPIILALVATQRLAELFHDARNTRALRRRGGVEHGRRHYPLFILLHGAWLAALLVAVPADAPVAWPLLAVYLVLQLARLWIIASLGPFWTTRIISLPKAPLVRRGPYRLLRHPNYWLVAIEVPLLPLVFGAWRLALLFGLANLALLAWRMRVEDRSLAPRREAAPP